MKKTKTQIRNEIIDFYKTRIMDPIARDDRVYADRNNNPEVCIRCGDLIFDNICPRCECEAMDCPDEWLEW